MPFRRSLPLFLVAFTFPAFPVRAADTGTAFNGLVDRFFSAAMPFQPTQATTLGIHDYDTKLEDWGQGTRDTEVRGLHYFMSKFDAMPIDGLDASTAGDLQIMRNYLRSQLLTLETIKPWQTNPDTYSSGITASAFSLMEREFAPPNDRLHSLIAREQQMPKVLDEARRNIQNPPAIYTEIALEQLPGEIAFFQNDVPAAFAKATDPGLQQQFAKTNAAVIAALTSYEQWVKADLQPRSHGDFRYGADTFSKALQYNEMVTTTLPQLLLIAMDDLHRNQAEFARVAKLVDPAKQPKEVLAELTADHPAQGQLLAAFGDQFSGLIGFIHAHKIVTMPEDVEPTLEETPPFERATTQASMDPPGPFETHSRTSYFNVTLPEKSWTPEHVQDYLGIFNVGTITSTAVHEAYPGHHVQELWANSVGLSKVRKIVNANTYVEGWAHYCEQMMLDEGYGQPGAGAKDEREANLIRLGQIVDALLRDARFAVAIQMHTGSMSLDQARAFFVDEGYQTRSVADVEVKRGTSDALYLYYTLGKLEILKLREDYRKKQGAAYSLQAFHDAFLRQGPVPIPIVRQALLGDAAPTL